jgi:hypothetical protein
VLEQEIRICDDADDFEIPDSHLVSAHPATHALPAEDT